MIEPTPKVTEITLRKNYRCMYENFVIATQHEVLLLLERNGERVELLRFNSTQMKYGSPNDEARGGHPLFKYGLGFYGFFEVENSPWINELMVANRVHPRHSDSMFEGMKHYVACFKDVMLEVACDSYEETHMSMPELISLVHRELDQLANA